MYRIHKDKMCCRGTTFSYTSSRYLANRMCWNKNVHGMQRKNMNARLHVNDAPKIIKAALEKKP